MHRLVLREPSGTGRQPTIAIVIERFDGRGGAEIATRDLAVWLTARGCTVHVVARSTGPRERELPIALHLVNPRGGRAGFAAAVECRLAEIHPDVSHDMGAAVGCDVLQPHVGSAVACQRAAERAYPSWYRPVRRFMKSMSSRRDLHHFTNRQFASPRSLILAVSRRVAADITSLHGVPSGRIRVVHNGIDAERFDAASHRESGAAIRRRLGFAPDDVVVIAAAHNARLKGLPVLERVIRRLRRDGVPVRMLACGSHRRRNDPAVVSVGCMDDMAPFYAAADIAAQPSFYDACSLVTLESLASSLPVITTRLNGASELITHGVSGFLIDTPLDEASLADTIAMLAADRWQRAMVGRAALALARAHRADAAFTAVTAIYAEVLAARGAMLEWREADAASGKIGSGFAA